MRGVELDRAFKRVVPEGKSGDKYVRHVKRRLPMDDWGESLADGYRVGGVGSTP